MTVKRCKPLVLGYKGDLDFKQQALTAAKLRCQSQASHLQFCVAKLSLPSWLLLPPSLVEASKDVWLCAPSGCESPLEGVLFQLAELEETKADISGQLKGILRTLAVHADIHWPHMAVSSLHLGTASPEKIVGLSRWEAPDTAPVDPMCWKKIPYTFSLCCFPPPKGNGLCWIGGEYSYERCCHVPLPHNLHTGGACFSPRAFRACCIEKKEMTSGRVFPNLNLNKWDMEDAGEPCWTTSPLRTYELCCSLDSTGISPPEALLALREAFLSLEQAKRELRHREARILQVRQGGLGRGPCPLGAELVPSAQTTFTRYSFPPFQLCVRNRSDVVDGTFRIDGIWFCDLTEHIIRLLEGARPVDGQIASQTALHIVDIGANIGACAVGWALEGHFVTAVEPQPESAMLLNASVYWNGVERRLRVIKAGATTGGYSGHIVESCGNSAHSSVTPWEPSNTTATCGSAQVHMHSLSHLLAFQQPMRARRSVDVVKIDVEGHETAVLCGALPLLKRDRPAVIFEFVPEWLQRHDEDWNFQANVNKYKLTCRDALRGDGMFEFSALILLKIFTLVDYAIYDVQLPSEGAAEWRLLPPSTFDQAVFTINMKHSAGSLSDLVALPREKAAELGLPVDESDTILA